MMNEKLIENLKAAKALINTPEKWKKRGWGNSGSGCYCALGAAKEAGHFNVLQIIDRKFPITAALMAQVPAGFRSVVEFNDHPTTTHADIMAVFNRAIAAAEAAQ